MPFSDILGHEREMAILKKAISGGRVAHSFIFSGVEGIGKRLTAVAFAKALNCGARKDDFCGVCQSCKGIDVGNSPNVVMIEPRGPESKGRKVDHTAGSIKIGDIREVQQRLYFKVDEGHTKVCVVDGAEKMTKEAANAFLKTLEEPQADTIIILITCRVLDLLSTIRSRCQRINFSPFHGQLAKELIKKQLNVSEEKAETLFLLSGGSIGNAINLYENGVLEERSDFISRISNLTDRDMNAMFEVAAATAGEDCVEDILCFLKSWYRDIAVVKEGADVMVINNDMSYLLERQARNMHLGRIVDGFYSIDQAMKDIAPPRYANKQLTMEVLLMDLFRDYE